MQNSETKNPLEDDVDQLSAHLKTQVGVSITARFAQSTLIPKNTINNENNRNIFYFLFLSNPVCLFIVIIFNAILR